MLFKKGNKKKFSSSKSIPPDQSSLKMKILRCTFALHTMVSGLNRHHLPLNPATYGQQKGDGFGVPAWSEGNAFLSAERLTAISLGSAKIDNQEFNMVADIDDSEDEECVLLGDEPGANSDNEQSSYGMVLQ